MSARFEFSLATAADDAQLRGCMAGNRMEGRIAISFRREPDYFAGCSVQGEQWQVIKCFDNVQQRIVGLGARYLLQASLNGEFRRAGYLSDLRGEPGVRSGTLLARGYRFLRALHDADEIGHYFSVIYSDNHQARQVLTSGRGGLPEYTSLGMVRTPAVHLDISRRPVRVPGLRITTASQKQLGEIFAFIEHASLQKNFLPRYKATDVGGPRLRGLRVEDILVAHHNGRIVGTMAAWDQGHFRQTHVEAYSGAVRAWRPVHNLLAGVSPLKPLPRPGAQIPFFHLALVRVQDNDIDVFRALLSHLHSERRAGPWHYLVAGLHVDDPLCSVLDEYRRIDAAGELFSVRFPDDGRHQPLPDNRPLQIETGNL